MPKILVADKIAEAGLERLKAAPGVSFDVRHGLPADQLAKAVGEYDGVLVRSAVQITKEVLAKPGRLSVIARAGVGVDNVDVDAATAAGVLVLNTPDANTVSTAEHTVALMLALHHRIADAHDHVVGGGWNRGAYLGDQLAGRMLGIVGFGRIGRAVAQRALALEMNVIAYDPFVTGESALDGAVKLTKDVNEVLRTADCITLHATLTAENRHMLGAAQFALMKKGARVINCARGALIDEFALAAALNSGQISGAALDVFENEPPEGSPLLKAKNILLTPHLAASTAEAQLKVSVDAADAIVAYLLRGEIRSAVNVTGLPARLTPHNRAYLDLCHRIGTLLSAWSSEGVEQLTVTVYGDALRDIAPTLSWQALVAVLSPHLEARLNLVNAREHAQRRGIRVEHVARSESRNLAESVVIATEARGQRHEIEGTIFSDGRPRVMSIDEYPMELIAEREMALIFNDDRPGVIGLVGQAFGNAGINIADMALSRRGRTALMVLKLDGPMPDNLCQTLRRMNPPILSIRTVSLPPVATCQSGQA
jgi:D-3-phosphoglycerate dehydrogenase